MEDKKGEFISLFDTLKDECIIARSQCNLWHRINKMPNDLPDLFSNGESFWTIAGFGIKETAFQRLFKIIYDTKNSVTIFKYLNFIESNKSIFTYVTPETLDSNLKEDDLLLKSYKDKFDKIIQLRHKYYVHLDKKYLGDYNKVFVQNPVTFDDINDIHQSISEILVKYKLYFDETECSIELTDERDIYIFLSLVEDLLTKERSERIEEAKRYLKPPTG